MHILLTGAAGRIGSHTLAYLVERGYDVTATDLVPIPESLLPKSTGASSPKVKTFQCNLSDIKSVDELFDFAGHIDGVIHFGAIPDALHHPARVVHNSNVTASYNVLETAASRGVRRIAQASSANAIGLSYGPPGHRIIETLPITEEEPEYVEDCYAISKFVCEFQAKALCRYYPGLRIASLRFHLCKAEYPTGPRRWEDIFAWTSLDACASSALLSLTSQGWEGAEAFNVAAPEICFDGVEGDKTAGPATLELVDKYWKGRIKNINKEWWKGFPRRSTWDSRKAERMLGWNHDTS